MRHSGTTLFLVLLSVTPLTTVRTEVDPLLAGIATVALGAAVATAGYFAYDYTHYASEQNCKDAINNFCKKAYSINAYVIAAEQNSLEPLIPVYKNLVRTHHEGRRSLNLMGLDANSITDQVLKQGNDYFAALKEERTRLERYKAFSNYASMSELQHAKARIYHLHLFYQKADSRAYDIYKVVAQIAAELHASLVDALNNHAHVGTYPLHTYLQALHPVFGIYKKFVQDNSYADRESSRLIQHVTHTIDSIKRSEAYYAEERTMKIENLRSTYRSLTTNLIQEQRHNDTLRREQHDLVSKNRTYHHLIQELKNRHYGHHCAVHTAHYDNLGISYLIPDSVCLYPSIVAHDTYGYGENMYNEIERLESAIASLRTSIAQVQQLNSSLRIENSDIAFKNTHLKKIIDELTMRQQRCYGCNYTSSYTR